ncbi:M28 family peptidase [Hymenobacter cavernae]|nr:M28 family peptidase [Hymenobacter cavernae]
MKINALAALVSGVLATQAALAQTQSAFTVPQPVEQALAQVQPNDIKAHIQYLADDKLQGRLPGTPGYQMAVDYVTEQLKKLGAQPAGEKGTYVQKVRLRRAFTAPGATLSVQAKQGQAPALTYGQDFMFYPNPEETQVSVQAPLVFAGYGISTPELGYDDYAGLDAKGKVVVIVRGAPKKFSSTVALYNEDLLTIMQTAARHGAVGVMVASTKPNVRLVTQPKGVISVLGPNGKVAVSRSFATKQIRMLGAVNAATLQNLFVGAAADTGRVLASLRTDKPMSQPLAGNLTAQFRSTYKDVDSYNVVGKIPGSDPKLKDEYVVHSAHLDHLGISTPVEGDSLYNGAHDNASGVASVLEIGKVYSRLKEKPKRSVLLVLVTGEEMGLMGSGYFAKYPTVPKAQIVADVNTDMPTIIAPLLSVVALGGENSSLQTQVTNAAGHLGLTVEPDPEPDQNRFIRSDQYSFVAQGIPALHIKYGNKTPDGQNNLSQTVQQWRAKYYHKPQDDINGMFDFEAGKKYVQLNFLIGYQIAQNPVRPTWNPGNFFGQKKVQ